MGKKKGSKGAQQTPEGTPKKSPAPDASKQSTSGQTAPSTSGDQPPIRGRGGFKTQELRTIPDGVTVVSTRGEGPGQKVKVLSNFITIRRTKEQKQIYSYRVDLEPQVEDVELKARMFYRATRSALGRDVVYDFASEARSNIKTPDEITHLQVSPDNSDKLHTVTLKFVGGVTPKTFEMLRYYNMHIKEFLRRELNFRPLGVKGGFVDPSNTHDIADWGLTAMRGFRTSVNLHEQDQTLMSLEPNHKFVQKRTIKDMIEGFYKDAQRARTDFRAHVSAELVGKVVITTYSDVVYRIEKVEFTINPKSSFTLKKTGQQITFADYFKSKGQVLKDLGQPMLLVIDNRRDKKIAGKEPATALIPAELCILTGLSAQQNNDFRLRTEMIRASQINPQERVKHIMDFMKKLRDNKNVKEKLANWAYSYDSQPTQVVARVMPIEYVGDGRNIWHPADAESGSFEHILMKSSLAQTPAIQSLVILVPTNLMRQGPGPSNPEQLKNEILGTLKRGFDKVRITLKGAPTIIDLPNDRPDTYANQIRRLPHTTTATIIVMNRQQKQIYDTIKKEAAVERGMITQVVTAKLLLDTRKSSGAAVKIALQVAAKVGGEPWQLKIPNKGDMICGYDTYHDTANYGRSYGAFLASMNDAHSRWFSRADEHDRKSEISPHMPANVSEALKRYQKLNKTFPKRVIIYRDGVGDGDLAEVLKTEVDSVQKAIKKVSASTLLTFVVVNKRIGARFYLIAEKGYTNPKPGSVIDSVVTRSSRFDFYLISQYTRAGTVTPTYYNVIYDQSKISPADHQALAYKLCFLYYNWAGTVRVPAPCQYAHKLALLCGEHLHRVPNENLSDRLHFL